MTFLCYFMQIPKILMWCSLSQWKIYMCGEKQISAMSNIKREKVGKDHRIAVSYAPLRNYIRGDLNNCEKLCWGIYCKNRARLPGPASGFLKFQRWIGNVSVYLAYYLSLPHLSAPARNGELCSLNVTFDHRNSRCQFRIREEKKISSHI